MPLTTVTGIIPTTAPTTTSSSGAVTSPLDVFAKEANMYKGEHYYFSCSPDSGGVAPSLYQQVLGLAMHEVWVWDAYFHQVDGAIFGSLANPSITIKMITEPKVSLANFKSGVVTNMETAMTAAIKAGCSITITQAKGMGFSAWKMHDRFLIVDKTHVFLIGSSVGNYLIAGESTGAYEVTDNDDKELIIKAFEYYWMQLDKMGNVESHSF